MKTQTTIELNEADLIKAVRQFVASKVGNPDYLDRDFVPDDKIEFKKSYSYDSTTVSITLETDDEVLETAPSIVHAKDMVDGTNI
jgi:hypothetical protein